MPYIDCPACKGTTIGKDGEECKTCDGTGMIWVKVARLWQTLTRLFRT